MAANPPATDVLIQSMLVYSHTLVLVGFILCRGRLLLKWFSLKAKVEQYHLITLRIE